MKQVQQGSNTMLTLQARYEEGLRARGYIKDLKKSTELHSVWSDPMSARRWIVGRRGSVRFTDTTLAKSRPVNEKFKAALLTGPNTLQPPISRG